MAGSNLATRLTSWRLSETVFIRSVARCRNFERPFEARKHTADDDESAAGRGGEAAKEDLAVTEMSPGRSPSPLPDSDIEDMRGGRRLLRTHRSVMSHSQGEIVETSGVIIPVDQWMTHMLYDLIPL